MKGLVIWAYSECRSMMGFYRELRNQASFPVVIAPYHHHSFKGFCTARAATGFTTDEFADVPMIPVGENWDVGKKILDDNPGFSHLFATYQGSPSFRRLMQEIKRRGERFGIISESPCNMSSGFRRWIKNHVYFRFVLPQKVRKVVEDADFVINLSGSSSRALRMIGWEGEKIVPWGYFSPPIPHSRCVRHERGDCFRILVTGLMTPHRAPDVVMGALILLKKWHIPFQAVFTQEGPLLSTLKMIAKDNALPVEFPGRLPMPELIRQYQTCSVYVAAGRHEPWGMRLNDALQCGAPLAVSRGMGGAKLVDDYSCGVTFENEDHVDLASKLARLATDMSFYETVSARAVRAAGLISPTCKAAEFLPMLEMLFTRNQEISHE